MAYGCARCGGLRRPAALRVCACAECEDRADRQGAIRDNGIELELNLSLLEPEQTGGWVASHFDIVDKISPGEPPDAASVYTHKLNFEPDTGFFPSADSARTTGCAISRWRGRSTMSRLGSPGPGMSSGISAISTMPAGGPSLLLAWSRWRRSPREPGCPV